MVDVTNYILYMDIKAKNQFTSLINACVSHELRNPLNSIIAKNIEKAALYQKLFENFELMNPQIREDPLFQECIQILEELDEGKTT